MQDEEDSFSDTSSDFCYSSEISSDDSLDSDWSAEEIDSDRNDVEKRKFKTSRNKNGSDNKTHIDNVIQTTQEDWIDPVGNQPKIVPFVLKKESKICEAHCRNEEDFFLLLVTENLFQEIAEQTNLYASQILSKNRSCWMKNWSPTSIIEIKALFGLVLWMELVKLPEISLYWSRDCIFAVNFPRTVMSFTRFRLLLKVINFANSEKGNVNESLHKIKIIIDSLNENFKKYYQPPENVYIDDSIIPYRGGESFSQYMKQNRQKFGYKIFKLCSRQGYTHCFKVYPGKNSEVGKIIPTNIVLSLCEDIVGKGHTLFVDSWYTNLDLAQKLLARDIHLVGTIRSHRRGLSKEVLEKKLKRGVFAKEHKNGITLLRWRCKQTDVLAISTKHSVELVDIRKTGRTLKKPAMIIDYEENKSADTTMSLMTAFSSPFRKILTWYRKVAFELILNTAVINAWILFNVANNTSISILEYRKKLVAYLCNCTESRIIREEIPGSDRHALKKSIGNPAKRRRCTSCYKKNVEIYSSEFARKSTKRVTTFCDDCPSTPFLCLPCFTTTHSFTKSTSNN